MASYKLPLKSLSLGVQEFSYHLDTEFFNADAPSDVRGADVDARVRVDRKSDDIFQVEMTFAGQITVACDRCLDDMGLPVDTAYSLSVKSGEAWDDSRDGVLVIPAAWHELDLAPLMRDSVLLTIPIVHAHPEGECNPDMLERLQQHSAHLASDEEMREAGDSTHSEGTDPRWDALKRLKDEN